MFSTEDGMQKIAYVFPGQGSQFLGMLHDLAVNFKTIEATFAIASEYLQYDLWALTQNGPEDQLNQTEFTQVAMLAADVAVFRVLSQHIKPADVMMAGHSLGEYAALVCANALDFVDAIALVQQRGRIMQANVPLGSGAMAAIVGLNNAVIEQICLTASTDSADVMPANYNAIGQVVIAGQVAAVQRALIL